MDEIVLIPIPLEEFKEFVSNTVHEALSQLNEAKSAPLPEDEFITIDEVCQLLKRSRPTIHKWKRKGILPFYRLEGNVYFKKSEVMDIPKKVSIR